MMTFEEAHEHLNGVGIDAVAKEMEGWHPAILGAMLQAVALAKQTRYPGVHGDYSRGAAAAVAAAVPPAPWGD